MLCCNVEEKSDVGSVLATGKAVASDIGECV